MYMCARAYVRTYRVHCAISIPIQYTVYMCYKQSKKDGVTWNIVERRNNMCTLRRLLTLYSVSSFSPSRICRGSLAVMS